MKVLFVEPPKEFWFVMGEYLPPPLGILTLAAYLEKSDESLEIEVVDCQAERIGWDHLEKRIANIRPDILLPSSLATCNAYTAIRTVETAKKIDPDITTIVGGQHFTATAHESLEAYPEIDIVVRGEGEQTVSELVRTLGAKRLLSGVRGISFRHRGKIVHNPSRPLLENLDELPFPGYHLVREHIGRYHFAMMASAKAGYTLVEASRGCSHNCTFCSQWRFWGGRRRSKSPKRIADEIEYLHREFDARFLWLTDDNFDLGDSADELCEEISRRGLVDEIMWFTQARCDDVIKHHDVLPRLRRAGNLWTLVGVESHDPETLRSFRKETRPSDAEDAMSLLKTNDIFAQATFIIGDRRDSHESIRELLAFANDIDPDLAIFMTLTPFPGTELHDLAERNGWIEDTNWADYDMVHAIMPTEKLTRAEVQEELYGCYRGFYGSMGRRIKGVFSPNKLKRQTYRYLASQGLLQALRNLF